METRLSQLEERLGRAERQVRTLRAVLAAGVVATVVLVASRPAFTQARPTPPGSNSTVTAPFRVVDL